MTNQIAIGLGIIILGLFGLDAVFYDWSYSLFLARKFLAFVEYLKFWR